MAKENRSKARFRALSKKSVISLALTGIMMSSSFMLTGCLIAQDSNNDTQSATGTIWKSGISYFEFVDAKVGDFFIDIDDHELWQKTSDSWIKVMDNYGKPEATASNIEMQVADGQIQWRYRSGSDTEWKNLLDVSTLNGANGYTPYIQDGYWYINGENQNVKAEGTTAKEIEIQKGTDAIQWRYEGAVEWNDLVALSLLSGEDGKSIKITTNADNIQWRYTDDSNEWQTIIKTSALKGADGTTPHIDDATGNWFIGNTDTGYKAAGINGKEVKLQVTADYIQWKYDGDAEWTNLIPLSSLKGANGSDGATWLSGEANPSTEGKDGDFYLNDNTYDIFKNTDGVWNKIGNIKGKDGSNGTNATTDVLLNGRSFIHISFDDVNNCFTNLKNKTYNSLYEEPFFNWLKSLHDTYGAKFSLYAYNNSLTNVPNTYAKEFLQAKDWLKIGLHATNSSSNFSSSTYEEGKSAWNTFVNNVVRITGSYLSVDRMPRLHTFAGSEEALKGMRDANYGAIGFLSADDARNSYYFNDATKDYLYYNDHVTDHKNGLIFVATDLRTDWFVGTSGNNEYRKPTKTNVYDELVYRYSSVEFANSTSSYILFGHEWQFYNGTTLGEGKQYFEDACKFAHDYDIGFDYSQNKAFNPTSSDIYPSSTIIVGGDEEESPSPTTVTYYNTEMTVVDSISEMVFERGYSVSGDADKDFNKTLGRATCITSVLAVNGGETIDFVSNLEEIFGSTDLSWALLEFSDVPLSTSTNVKDSDASRGKKWLTGDSSRHTLSANTKYVILAFKNGNGTVDFTDEQLQVLCQCLTIS